jgi:DNA-binding NarL/FixJ family response regulator
MNNPLKIALVDDHVLLRNGLAELLNISGFEVISQSNNGKDFVDNIKPNLLPDLVFMDINMPVMDGFETTLWISNNYPDVKVIALSMYDDESSIIRMIKNGARGYVLKDVETPELKQAIDNVVKNGFHYSEAVTGKLIHSINNLASSRGNAPIELNEKEVQFLKLVATEMTYKEIANEMHLSPRTIDGYRDQLFEKLSVKSRIGLVLYAIKENLVRVDNFSKRH